MRISVIITCYSEGQLLRRAIRSVEAQTDRDIEVILVNDSSPDPETNRICREAAGARSLNIRLIRHEENRGLSVARNTGFRAATGDVCLPLDADDELPGHAVATIRGTFAAQPEADFAFGDYIRHDVKSGAEERVDCSRLCGETGILDPGRLCRKWTLLGTSPCKKSTWASVGGYREKYTYVAQDVDFWMRVLQTARIGVYIPRPLYRWNCAEGSMSKREDAWHAGYEVRLENLAFFDIYGAGAEVREKLLRYHLVMGNYDLARKLAKQLIELGGRSYRLRTLAALPGWTIGSVLRIYKRVRQYAR